MSNFNKIMFFSLWITAIGIVAPVFAVTPKHGWLKTKGAYILNEKGNIVQLKGMSFYWSTPSWPGYKYYNAGTVDALVDTWKCTVVRAAYDRSNGWDGVKAVINESIAKGIYVIIDWHCHDAQTNTSQAVNFFTEQANAYKNTPNVIFELFNEPIVAGDAIAEDGSVLNAAKTWVAIKPYLTEVTKAIRNTGSKNLIILGTPYYCQHVDVAANSQVVGSDGKPFENVAYSFHFYAASHGPKAYYVDRDGGGVEHTYIDVAIGKIPLFVTEWGTTHRDGGEGGKNTQIDGANTDWWFQQYIDKYHIGHCNWSVSDFQTSSAFSGGTSPSASGQIVQKYIKSAGDEFVPEWVLGFAGPAADSEFTMPAPFHAAASFNRYYGTHAESASVAYTYRDKVDRRLPGLLGYTVLNITPSELDNWVYYKIKSTSATKYIHLRYHAKDGNGTVEVLLDDTKAGQAVLTSDPTWKYAVIPVDVAAGTHKLKFNFVNTTGTSYQIEWFELTNESKPPLTSISGFPHLHSFDRGKLTATAGGFAVELSSLHPYTAYSLVGINGQTVRAGKIDIGTNRISFADLPGGLWLLKLEGPDRSEQLKVTLTGR